METKAAIVSASIHQVADHIEREKAVSAVAIPALVTLLRGIAAAAAEHQTEELPITVLCADEMDAYHFAIAELGEPTGDAA